MILYDITKDHAEYLFSMKNIHICFLYFVSQSEADKVVAEYIILRLDQEDRLWSPLQARDGS